jgi:hypothetical protein
MANEPKFFGSFFQKGTASLPFLAFPSGRQDWLTNFNPVPLEPYFEKITSPGVEAILARQGVDKAAP